MPRGNGTSKSDDAAFTATYRILNLHTNEEKKSLKQALESEYNAIATKFDHHDDLVVEEKGDKHEDLGVEEKGDFQTVRFDELSILQKINDLGYSVKLVASNVPEINTRVQIQGMTCGACSAAITQALEKQPGVSKASISLVTENGLISHSRSIAGSQIINIIQDCGFDAQLQSTTKLLQQQQQQKQKKSPIIKQTTIGVSGMTCGACSSSITMSLEKLENVQYVSVSLITEEALIRHTPEISQDELKSAIQDCGFDTTYIRTVDLKANQRDSTTSKEKQEGQPQEEVKEYEEVTLKLVGLNSNTDQLGLRYNIEAFLHSIPGIGSFYLTLLGTDASSLDVSAPARIRDLVTEEDTASDIQGLINELVFSYDSNIIGIRDVVDGLNKIDDRVTFFVINSLDQSSASQLKVLSKVKDIQYWKNISIQSLIVGIPILFLVHTEKMAFWKKTMLFPGLYLVSLVELVLSTYMQFHLGANYIKKFASFLKRGFKGASMDVLVCISTMVSYIFSVTSIIVSVWYGRTTRPPKVLFDTLVMLISFVSFGKLLENKAKGATSTALSSLLQLTPSTCTILENASDYESRMMEQEKEYTESSSKEEDKIHDFQTRSISIDLVQPNDIAIVLPGGKIPADGIIVFGETEVNESFITGEPLPIYKSKGDSVIGGSINGAHLIYIRVTNTGNKSQLQQIINLVKDSQVNKAPVQRFSDLIAAKFVPSVLILALATFIIWLIVCYFVHSEKLPMIFRKDENGKFFVCLQLAISVVVVACPCALGLAAPTAVMVGTGVGASNGVLIKGADILEKTTSINVLLFDKTGTLTTGEMTLAHAKPILYDKNMTISDWWQLVGSVECNSEHPIGRALAKSAKSNCGLNFEEDVFDTTVEQINVLIGSGIEADVVLGSRKYHVHVGNAKLLKEKFPDLLDVVDNLFFNSQNTITFVVINGKYSGYIELSDSLREGSREVIDYLKNVEGYIIGMVTGDNKGAALKIGKEVGIAEENIFYEVSPVHKDKVITDIKNRFGTLADDVGIAFIGDGINDAPALAKADIGMAISSGTDIAIESADIVLIGNRKQKNQTDLHGVVNALKISNMTFSRIKLNFLWAIIYNTFMLPFAMGCFLPFNLMLPPVAASIAMMTSSLSVVFSSLLLKCWKSPNLDEKVNMTDLESGREIEDFSLKNGTKEQFKAHRRKKSLSFGSLFAKLTRRGPRVSSSNPSYELVGTRF
ncbi:CCC2 [Candida oxycetoniae]|uniref:P-type Cu(+) transporter n=1 Tax=Candida oxycetoniae TaxID=497107 RepID=A0AAI9SW39_9ASCO|nr:CCC2 [Candida oxycetoniae]KAI3404163.2 CCC2 [Candida oxycetoniae]